MGKASSHKLDKRINNKVQEAFNNTSSIHSNLIVNQNIRSGELMPPADELVKLEDKNQGSIQQVLDMTNKVIEANIKRDADESRRIFWYHQTGQIFEFIIALILAIGGLAIMIVFKYIYTGLGMIVFGFSPILIAYFKKSFSKTTDKNS